MLDVTPLQLFNTVKAGQLPLPETVKLHGSADTMIARVAAQKVEAEPVPVAVAAPETAEPEVVGKGKKEVKAEEAEE